MAEPATTQCPQCGSSLTVDQRFSHMAVCGACRSVVTFGADAARVAGRLSVLPAPRSELWVGATGRVRGKRFTVIGRVRYGWARGYWDEWFLAGDDAAPIWLSEDEGELSLESPLGEAPGVTLGGLEPGASLEAGGRTWRVSERGVSRCEGGEGQLPFVIVQGEEVPFADLEGPGRTVGTLEVDADGARLFEGEILRPGELELDQGRSSAGITEDLPVARKAVGDSPERLTQMSGSLRAVSCTQCGGGMEVETRGGVPERVRCPYCDNVEALRPTAVTCPSCAKSVPVRSGDEAGVVTCGGCRSLISLRSSAPTVLAKLAGKGRRPPVALGSKVNLRGVTWEATGWLLYEGRSEGETFQWDELLLFSDRAGYAWLELSDGHASIGVKVVGGPAVGTDAPEALSWRGQDWRLAEQCTARVLWVEGELPWVAMAGDQVRTAEFARPPQMLSAEWTEGEVEWTIADYVPHDELRAAVSDPSRLPRPEGVAPHQPYSRAAAQALWVTAVFLVMAIAMLVWSIQAGAEVAALSFDDDAYDDGQISDSFAISQDDITVEVAFDAPGLDNQWVYARAALLDEEGGIVSEWSSQMSYYHGVDGGESWTEGNTSDNALLRVEKAGTYRIGVEAEAGMGNAETASPGFTPPIQVRVLEGAMPASWTGGYLAVCLILFVILGAHRLSFVRKQKGADDDDDD